MIKIAYVTKNLASNGITNVVMNYGIRLDKTKFQLTIITGAPIELKEYREKCEKNEIKIVELPAKDKSAVRYYLELWKELSNNYDIVHVHGNSAMITIEMLMSKLAGIKVRIAHCHNVTCDHTLMHRILQPLFKKLYTYGLACSTEAGEWMFGNSPYEVLPNAFQTEKFIFDDSKRNAVRESLKITDKFVIGNVARFNDQKNHEYLLQIFEGVAKKRDDAVLLLVGNGPNLSKIKKKIEEHPYHNRIIYYGITDNVTELYSAMDVFVLPTKYEGLGIVFVEAQINGLPVVTSDQVPREVNIENRVQFLPLKNDVQEWVDAILTAPQIERKSFYIAHNDAIERYDISKCVLSLEEKYKELVEEAEK